MSETIEKKIRDLRREIERHDNLYHVQAKPEISDRDYDHLMRQLIDLETARPEFRTGDSPSQRVGGDVIDEFRAVEHAVPMMSIDNTYDEAEVRAFDTRIRKALGESAAIRYVVEPKVDGVAASLRYEQGSLVLAATRGDGRRGDDVTANVKTVKSIPLHLHGAKYPDILEVRGEIFLTSDVFQAINHQRESAGEETFKNPRNLTAGTLKQLDPKITASRKLRFISHGLGQVSPAVAESYWEILQRLRQWGLPTGEHLVVAENVAGVIEAIEQFAKIRGTLAYQTDGMVVKVDSLAQRDALGVTSKSPRWVIAFKYAAEQAQTILHQVDWQVGKAGTLTPVARLEPVFLAGSTVSNATLHNIEQIQRLGLHVGDTVVVEKAGEVIPYIPQAVPEKRPKHAKPVEPPTHCPSCHSPVEKEADTPYIRCVNPVCPAQFRERLKWFCGRNQMDIENVGEALADQLVDAGLVKTFADLYRLTVEQLTNLERMGTKSATNVVEAVAASKSRSLDRLLAALGIRHVGNRVATVLAGNFASLDALAAATPEQLAAVHEIGDVIAQSVHDFFQSAAGRDTVEQLKSAGVDPRSAARPAVEQILAGQAIVVTGSLKQFTRPRIEELISQLGGRPAGSVSKKTSFVVAGEEAGSKLEKARALGVPVLTEAEFLAKIGRA